MPVCEMCGVDHHPEAVEAAAEIEAAEAMADGAEGAAHEVARADVEVAKVEAERDVEVARINAKVEAGWQEARVAELEGQVSGMREVLDRIMNPPAPDPEPEPEPVAVAVDDGPPAPEQQQAPPAAPKQKSKGWWG